MQAAIDPTLFIKYPLSYGGGHSDKMFLDPHGAYWVKIVVIFMIFMAIRGKVVTHES